MQPLPNPFVICKRLDGSGCKTMAPAKPHVNSVAGHLIPAGWVFVPEQGFMCPVCSTKARAAAALRRPQYGQACPTCGDIMVRTGSCETCPSCGTSGGCG